MRIRTKTLAVIGVAVVASTVANLVVLKASIFPSFAELERAAAERDVTRALEAVDAEIHGLSATLWDYSSWNDSVKFAQGSYPDFPEINLATDSMENLNVEIIEVYDSAKKPLYAGINEREAKRTRQGNWSFRALDSEGLLFKLPAEDGASISGIMRAPDGPVIVASRPILTNDGQGPSPGTFLFGRFLNDKLVQNIRDRTKVDFEIVQPSDFPAAQSTASFPRLAASKQPVVIADELSDALVSYGLLRDVGNTPILAVRTRTRRDISAIGRRVLLASAAGVALAGLIIMSILGILMQRVLIGPLMKLTDQILAIGVKGDTSGCLNWAREDEIGTLSREFDGMLGKLAAARNKLLEQSYFSGIAEMAAGVLHNLRNQLTPLRMRVERLREDVAMPSSGRVQLAVQELADAAPERRDKLAKYLTMSLRDIEERQERTRARLAGLSGDLDRIEEVLNELDRFSHANDQPNAVALASVVGETVALLPRFDGTAMRIDVDAVLAKQQPVIATSFVLKHVLHSLFVNAMEAIVAAGRQEGQIRVSALPRTIDGLNYVDLLVTDDGIGIAARDLQRIFTRGYTTKTGARRGTGLHWCANRIGAVKGRLFAESDGLGRGATLHILLPSATDDPQSTA